MTITMYILFLTSWVVLGAGLAIIVGRTVSPRRKAQHALKVMRRQSQLDITLALERAQR